MIIVKVSVEKDGIPVEMSFEADDKEAISMTANFISTLQSNGFKVPSKTVYKGKGGKRENSLDYDPSTKTLKIVRVKIKDNEQADNEDKGLMKKALAELKLRYDWNGDKFRYEVVIPDWQTLLRIDDNEYFKKYSRRDGFKKAVADIRDKLAKRESQKSKQGNPF